MTPANFLRLGILACIWGSSFLFIEVALEGLAPVQIVLARLLSASVALTAVVLVGGRRLPSGWQVWGHLALMGLAANVGAFFLMSWGQQTVTSGLAGVLNAATPLFTVGFAAVILSEEELSRRRWIGLIVGFVGVALVLGPWDQDPLTSSVSGQVACLTAAIVYAAAFVYTRRFIAPLDYPAMSLAAGQLVAAAAILAVGTPVILDVAPITPNFRVVGSVLVLGVVGTALAYMLYYRLIVEAGATSASLASYISPVVAVALGVLVLREPMTWNLFVGAPIVIVGIAMTQGRPVPSRSPVPADGAGRFPGAAGSGRDVLAAPDSP